MPILTNDELKALDKLMFHGLVEVTPRMKEFARIKLDRQAREMKELKAKQSVMRRIMAA